MSIEAMKLALEALELIAYFKLQPDTVQNLVNHYESALRQAIEQAQKQEPVAHCEAGPEYCWKCNEEIRPTYGSEEIRKLREVNKRLADHIPDAKEMVDALREIGDFAHDKSTGPTVPDALWEIREMAYSAMEDTSPPQRQPEQEPIGEVVTAGVIRWKDKYPSLGTKLYTSPQRQWVGLTEEERQHCFNGADGSMAGLLMAIEAKLKEKNT